MKQLIRSSQLLRAQFYIRSHWYASLAKYTTDAQSYVLLSQFLLTLCAFKKPLFLGKEQKFSFPKTNSKLFNLKYQSSKQKHAQFRNLIFFNIQVPSLNPYLNIFFPKFFTTILQIEKIFLPKVPDC